MTGQVPENSIQQQIQAFRHKTGHAPRVLLLSETEGSLGHARIASTLAKRIREMGGEVVIASGDIHEDIFDFGGALRSLPPVNIKVENKIATEYTPDGTPYQETPVYKLNRKHKLLEVVKNFPPDIVVFEFYPLSYRDYRAHDMETLQEYCAETEKTLPFVTIARDSTIRVSQTTKEKKQKALEHFDYIFARGWKEIEWKSAVPLPQEVLDKIEHLGHILADKPQNNHPLPSDKQPVIVVYSGGEYWPSDTLLLHKAIEASKHSAFANQPWKIIVSKECPDAVFKELQQKAADEGNGNITVTHTYDNETFSKHLANCKAAIVRGSYNTTLELASSGKPFVTIPHASKGYDVEHENRARFFAENGIATTVTEAELAEENGAALLAQKLFEATQLKPAKNFTYENGSQFAERIIQIAMEKKLGAQKENTSHNHNNNGVKPDKSDMLGFRGKITTLAAALRRPFATTKDQQTARYGR